MSSDNQSPIPSQEQEDLGWYIPGAMSRADMPQIPIGQSGSQPASSFVVSTYDARPGNAYDVFASLNSDLNLTYTIPAGYVGILRDMAITAYMQSAPTFSGFTVVDRWGFPTVAGFFGGLDLRFDLIQNGTPVKDLSDFLINDAVMTTLNVPVYFPFDEQTVVQPLVRLGPVSQFVGTMKYLVDCRFNLLPKTGAQHELEPTNKLPLWVKAGTQP